jgi:trehalose-6-phosphate synthase
LERLKGLQLIFLGIELFLQSYPDYVSKISFVMVGITSSEMGEEYISTRNEVSALAKRISSLYPGAISFEEKKEAEMNLLHRLCLFVITDVLIVGGFRSSPFFDNILFFSGMV